MAQSQQVVLRKVRKNKGVKSPRGKKGNRKLKVGLCLTRIRYNLLMHYCKATGEPVERVVNECLFDGLGLLVDRFPWKSKKVNSQFTDNREWRKYLRLSKLKENDTEAD